MRRRRSFLKTVTLWGAFLLAISSLWGSVVAPGWIHEWLERIPGRPVTVGNIRVIFPMWIVLSDVRVAQDNPVTVVSADEVAIIPLWLSWRHRMLWLQRLTIRGIRLQARRTAQGAVLKPVPDLLASAVGQPSQEASPPGDQVAQTPSRRWRLVVRTLELVEGTIGFVDEKPATPFYGTLSQVFFVGGPLNIPLKAQQVTLAVRGVFSGANQRAAPVYCSGWVDVDHRNLDVSCQLEPLPFAAFEPYYQGGLPVKVYDARISARGRLAANANRLDGRVQLEIDQLSEADLASLGRAGDDIKKLTGEGRRALTGEFQLSGPLDRPSEWRFQLVPGNDVVQRLVNPLLGRGIEVVRIRLGGFTIPVGLVPATEATKADSEAASQQLEEALAIIAPAAPVEPALPSPPREALPGVPEHPALPAPQPEPAIVPPDGAPSPVPSQSGQSPSAPEHRGLQRDQATDG